MPVRRKGGKKNNFKTITCRLTAFPANFKIDSYLAIDIQLNCFSMRKLSIIFTIIFLTGYTTVFSQQVYHFTKGLLLPSGSRYGREALYADPLAYKLYTNSMRAPAEGDSFNVNRNGQVVKWQSITADSANRLRGRGQGFGGGGYIYLTYTSEIEQRALLNIKGNGAVIFNGEHHAGDAYGLGWLYIPVNLKKGLNELYVRGQNIIGDLIFPEKPIFLNTEDPTLPSIVPGNATNDLMGAIVVINASAKALTGLQIKSSLEGKEMITNVPSVLPMSSRKIIFHFDGSAAAKKGQYDCRLQLLNKSKVLDEKKVMIDAVDMTDKYSSTFISNFCSCFY